MVQNVMFVFASVEDRAGIQAVSPLIGEKAGRNLTNGYAFCPES